MFFRVKFVKCKRFYDNRTFQIICLRQPADKLIMSSVGMERWNNISVSSWSTEQRIEQLKPSKRYRVRLRAKNELGTSEPSREVEFATGEEGDYKAQ